MMDYLDVVIEDQVAHVRLNRGRSNALHAPMIQELDTLLQQLDEDPSVRGILLQGKDGFFSAGLDLIALYEYDEHEIRALWVNFIGLARTFIAVGKPVLAAINGHSPAGGCVLALCADYRVMAEGEFVIGLNELPVGIVVPQSIFHLYSFWIGQGQAYRNLLEGRLLRPEEALSMGVVDELAPKDQLISTAERQLRKYMQLDTVSWRQSKKNLRKSLIQVFDADQEEDIEAILNQWWTPQTRALLKSIIDNLKSKK
ncbi:MAG TPA: enoyl-CoA hydratase/isomerase family protein [Sphingobacteriaceae bacterium]|nr:enoyl-CoA hydratase/isomerase family protein [Sphingobacteriaceae bacterium]